MDIKKLTPLVITGVLIVLAIILYINNNKKISTYQTLNIKYNNQNYEYENFINFCFVGLGTHCNSAEL